MFRSLAALIVLAAAALPAAPANFSGKWALQAAGGRGGFGGATILTLTQTGQEVTGTISVRIDAGTNSPVNDEIWGGKADGDTVTFYVWTGTDQPVKTTYTGIMAASGDEITFTVTGDRGAAAGRGQTGPRQITAKRTK
jgi:hypothetical protein